MVGELLAPFSAGVTIGPNTGIGAVSTVSPNTAVSAIGTISPDTEASAVAIISPNVSPAPVLFPFFPLSDGANACCWAAKNTASSVACYSQSCKHQTTNLHAG